MHRSNPLPTKQRSLALSQTFQVHGLLYYGYWIFMPTSAYLKGQPKWKGPAISSVGANVEHSPTVWVGRGKVLSLGKTVGQFLNVFNTHQPYEPAILWTCVCVHQKSHTGTCRAGLFETALNLGLIQSSFSRWTGQVGSLCEGPHVRSTDMCYT